MSSPSLIWFSSLEALCELELLRFLVSGSSLSGLCTFTVFYSLKVFVLSKLARSGNKTGLGSSFPSYFVSF